MSELPPIPQHRDWSKSTWRAGLDEAVRRNTNGRVQSWSEFCNFECASALVEYTIAHAITLLDNYIIDPAVSEAEQLYADMWKAEDNDSAIAVIQDALDKARAGE